MSGICHNEFPSRIGPYLSKLRTFWDVHVFILPKNQKMDQIMEKLLTELRYQVQKVVHADFWKRAVSVSSLLPPRVWLSGETTSFPPASVNAPQNWEHFGTCMRSFFPKTWKWTKLQINYGSNTVTSSKICVRTFSGARSSRTKLGVLRQPFTRLAIRIPFDRDGSQLLDFE